MLGVRAEARPHVPRRRGPAGRDRVVVLGHALWQQRFGGDRDVIGRSVVVDGIARTIVGVMPADFRFPSPTIDFWVPVSLDASPANDRPILGTRVTQRHRPVATRRAAFGRRSRRLPRSSIGAERRSHGGCLTRGATGVTVVPLERKVVGDVGPMLMVLFGAVAVVLLIACVNVANLLLGRAAAREREIAIRASLGAGRGRIVRQLLTESVMLGLLGGARRSGGGGGGCARAAPAHPRQACRASRRSPSMRACSAFTMVTALATGLAFGLAPALRASRPTLQTRARRDAKCGRQRSRGDGSPSCSSSRQIALGVVLVAGAGLLIKSFWRLHQVRAGLPARTGHRGGHSDSRASRRTARRAARLFFDAVLEQARAIPGVTVGGGRERVAVRRRRQHAELVRGEHRGESASAWRAGTNARADGRERRLLQDDGHPADARTGVQRARIAMRRRRSRSWTS